MNEPKITRPIFPEGYLIDPKAYVAWEAVVEKLTHALHYWLCTVSPDGRPHAVPRWGVMVGERFYYDGSPETRHARNLARSPYAALHLEDGADVVIANGRVDELKESPLALRQQIAEAYTAKYAELGYSPEPSFWEAGGLYRLTIETALAWTSFGDDPTKFVFE